MSIDRSEVPVSLLDAARVLARGGDLDAKLEALAGHARGISGATSGAVLLFDPASGQLGTPDGAQTIDPGTADDALAAAIRDRRIVPREGAGGRAELAAIAPGAERALVPLVVEDEAGVEVEGVLVLGFESAGGAADSTRDALGALADLAAVAILQARLENALLEHAEYQQRLAHTDPLTGLANRRTFEQMLELELARAARQGAPVSVCLFEVDGLDGIRAEHGAGAADEVLRQVAATLASQVRLVDTVARVRAGEFGLIAPGDGGSIVAGRVRDAVAALEPMEGLRITINAGIARHPEDGTTLTDLLTAATGAARKARAQGPGSVVLATEIAAPESS